MADIDKRLKYYTGQFLQEQDFTAEQEYHLDRLRRHNRQHHVPGIADGLEVTAALGATSASVSPGTAIDLEGRQIVLTQPHNVAFASLTNQWVLVVISYDQEESDDATVGDAGKTRWLERPDVNAIPENGAPPKDLRIRLARLRIAANGTIAEIDTAVRTPAGAKLRPEETVERLRLSRQGVPSAQWPVLSSGAPNRADLASDLSVTGNIAVTGNIVVTGTVDGRDVSADAALNQTHRDSTNNPHAVTALQAGAITGVGSVTNPGGQVNLLAGTNIAITPDNGVNKRITIASSSIDGVSNPGGNIDFVGLGGITITADNSFNKKITFTSNALPATDYLNRTVMSGSFAAGETTKTVPCGFRPRYISVSFSSYADFSGRALAITSTAYVEVFDGGGWFSRGSWQHVLRLGSAPYWESKSAGGYSELLWLNFLDTIPSPDRQSEYKVTLDSVSNSGCVLRLNRISNGFFVNVHFQITVLG